MKKPVAACAVLAVVLIFGTLFGTHRSLSAQRRSASEVFYQGSGGDGYSIESNLDHRMEYAVNLCKIASGYDAQAECAGVSEVLTELQTAQNASEKYDANLALTGVVGYLDQRLQALELTEEDTGYRKSLMADFASYQMKIDKQAVEYNAGVRRFNEEILGGFPARVLGPLTGVRTLEEFA